MTRRPLLTGSERSRSRQQDATTLRRVAPLFRPYRAKLVAVALLTLLASALGLVNPLLTRVVIDDAIGGRNLRLLWIVTGLMLAAPVASALINVLQTYLNALVGQRVMRDLRGELYGHLQRMLLAFFTTTRTGEIQSRLANDIGGVEGVLTTTLTGIIRSVATALSIATTMLLLSPLLTIISLGFVPLVYLVSTRVGKMNRRVNKERQERLGSITALMEETLSVSGALLVKLFAREPLMQTRFAHENQGLADVGVRQQLVGNWFFSASLLIFALAPVLVYLVAGLTIIQDPGAGITLGVIVAFTQLQARLVGFGSPITQLLGINVQLQGALALFDRIYAYLDMPVTIRNKQGARPLDPARLRGTVTFRAVSFAYPQTPRTDNDTDNISPDPTPFDAPSNVPRDEMQRMTLDDISFEAKPGQLVALVGPSGAGKSTLISLVPRLYDVTSGAVEIDHHNVKEVTLESLSKVVGMVTQESYLFHASVRDNLLFARDGASEQEMVEAAKAAAIHDRIMALEHGYDTLVGERGYKLSGGEKQRVAIARAILKNPRILILDEATSALDSHAERLIQEALERLMRGRTTLAIAHRLSTILEADQILVLEGGRIVERGTHHDLLSHHGLYTRLYQEQFAGGAAP